MRNVGNPWKPNSFYIRLLNEGLYDILSEQFSMRTEGGLLGSLAWDIGANKEREFFIDTKNFMIFGDVFVAIGGIENGRPDTFVIESIVKRSYIPAKGAFLKFSWVARRHLKANHRDPIPWGYWWRVFQRNTSYENVDVKAVFVSNFSASRSSLAQAKHRASDQPNPGECHSESRNLSDHDKSNSDLHEPGEGTSSEDLAQANRIHVQKTPQKKTGTHFSKPTAKRRCPNTTQEHKRQCGVGRRFFVEYSKKVVSPVNEAGFAEGGEPNAWLELVDGELRLVCAPIPLPPFVRKLRLELGGSGQHIMAENARTGWTRISVPWSPDDYKLIACDFEQELSPVLEPLQIAGFPLERGTVFVEIQNGSARRQETPLVPRSKRVIIAVPPALSNANLPAGSQDHEGGWRTFRLEPMQVASEAEATLLAKLGLEVGEATLGIGWAGPGASRYRRGRGGEAYPCFETGQPLLLRVSRSGLALAATVIVSKVDGAGGAIPSTEIQGTELELPPGDGPAWIELLGLAPGQYVLDAVSELVGLRDRLFFAIETQPKHSVTLVAELVEGGQAWALPAEGDLVRRLDLACGELPALRLPPCWPVSLRWRGRKQEWLGRLYADERGLVEAERVRALLGEHPQREPAGELLLDAGELGRLRLQHDRKVDALALVTGLRELVARGRGLGWRAPEDVLDVVLRPTAELLGYGIEGPASFDGGFALRLGSTLRRGAVIRPGPSALVVALREGLRVGEFPPADLLERWCGQAEALGVRRVLLAAGAAWLVLEPERRWVGAALDMDAAARDDAPLWRLLEAMHA